MGSHRDCVSGTGDAEIRRLDLQHRSWRSSTLELWRAAGIAPGMTVIDVAAGPGFAAFELSGLVGPRGRVVALERSPSLAMALTMMAEARRLTNIAVLQTDIASFAWPEGIADVVWCRFALALLKDPVSALQGMVRTLKPGGAILLQEAFDCRSWRLAPRSPEFESYVAKLIEKRRADGEEPEIGLDLQRMLIEAGMRFDLVQPITFATQPGELAWEWRVSFVRNHVQELAAADVLSPAEADTIQSILADYESKPDTRMFSSGVLQVVARKPR